MSTTLPDKAMTAGSAVATAPAKINLTLDVLDRRADGFHEIRSLVIGVDLCDHVRCDARESAGIEVYCDQPSLRGSDNLAGLAAGRLAHHVGRKEFGLGIRLEKQIPVGGGLGGGSSDAAATLRLCNEIWATGLTRDELAVVGAAVGSDVPLFFFLPTAVVHGRGERVEPVTLRWSGWVLLASVQTQVATAEVYRAWRRTDGAGMPTGTARQISEAVGAEAIAPLLSNHLEPAIFRVAPQVARAYDTLHRAGVGPLRVSGAGSTLYRLFDEKEAACRTAGTIENLGLGIKTWVVAAPVEAESVVSEDG